MQAHSFVFFVLCLCTAAALAGDDGGNETFPVEKLSEPEQKITAEQTRVLNTILYVTASFSAVGSLFICLTYTLWSAVRSFGTRLVFFMSLSDFFTAVCWYPWNLTPWLCQIQASLIQFFVLASYAWSFSVALVLFVIFFKDSDAENVTTRLMPLFHVINWGYPLTTVVLCLAFNRFGPAGAWCWVQDPVDPFRLFVYAPLMVILVLMVGLFVAIRVRLSSMPSSMTKNLSRRLSFYLLAFILSQLPAAVNRAQNFLDPAHPQMWLFVIQAVFQPLQGMFNAIVYGLCTDVFIDQWKIVFRKYCFVSVRLWLARCLPNLCGDDDIRHSMSERRHLTTEVPDFDYDYESEDDGLGGIN